MRSPYLSQVLVDTDYYLGGAPEEGGLQEALYEYEYDLHSNRTRASITADGVTTSQQWAFDLANRLIGWGDGTSTASYTYNGYGDRISQTVDSQTTQYQLDLTAGLTQVVGEFSPGDSTWYLLGLDLIAQESSTTGWSYPLTDALGSVRATLAEDGTTSYATNYDPYGNPLAVGGLTQTAFGFTGQQTDSTGLQYLRARYYSPALGSFLTTDPVLGVAGGPASTFNPYSYVRGNTINLTDPSGKFPFLLAVGLGSLLLGGLIGLVHDLINQLKNNGGNWDCLNLENLAESALLGAGIGLTVGLTAGIGAMILKPWLIPIAGTAGSQNPDKVQKAVDVIGEVGESISHALTNGDASAIQDALPDLSAVVTNAIPRLTPGDGGAMFREAIGFLKELPENATIRAEWFEDFARQITDLSTTEWKASLMPSSENTFVYAGTFGNALVISPDGNLYTGNINYALNGFIPLGSRVPQFIYENTRFIPLYENLKRIE